MEIILIVSAKYIGPSNRAKAILSALLVSGLSACGNGNSGATVTAPAVNNKGLWIANGTNVLEYVPSQLAGGTSAALPHLVNSSAVFGAPQGVTFDAHGNLWVMDPAGMINGVATPALFEFSAAQLAALATNPKPDPIATITSTALSFPQQSVFDSQGNQWVTDHNNNTVLVFTAAQLAQSGPNSTMPAVVISSADFNGPLGVAFDANGNLWVANNGGVPGANGAMSAAGTTIVEFLAAHLSTPPATGMLTPLLAPDVVLSDDGQHSIQGPWALTFDSTGNLWSSNGNTPFTLVEFSMTSLAATGAPVPAVTLSPTMVNGYATLNAPNGLCFDNIGDLAATNSAGAFGIAVFAPAALTTGGATVPQTFIVGPATTLNAPAGCNFGSLVN
jgi:secreted PhoX family phosphatase